MRIGKLNMGIVYLSGDGNYTTAIYEAGTSISLPQLDITKQYVPYILF